MGRGAFKLYLAGPEVFLPDPLARAAELKAACRRHGAEGLFPADVGITGLEGRALAEAIRAANMRLIASCDGIVANMDPFRGPSMDAGTAYEMGVGAALGKPVVGYAPDRRDYRARVADAMPLRMAPDGTWRDADGMSVEDFGLPDNLMMACGAAAVLGSFEEAVAFAVGILAGRRPAAA